MTLKMDDSFFALVKQVFGTGKAKPTNRKELKILFVFIVKKATSKDVIKSNQSKRKEDRDATKYTLNEALIKHHLELNAIKNKKCRGFASDVVEKFELKPADDFECLIDVSGLDD